MLNDPGPRLLALHGFTGAGCSWDGVRAHLPGSWRVSAPDLPGHGGPVTGAEDLPTSFENCVDRLAAWLRSRSGNHHVDPVHVVGYSLGARLALGLLVTHPGLVRSATLIGVRPGLAGSERTQRAAHDDRLAAELLADGLEAFVDRWQYQPLFASQRALDPELLARQRQLRLGHDPHGLAWALRTLSPGRMPDYRPSLARVERTVCLMAGELDERCRKIANETRHLFTNPEIRSGNAAIEVEIVAGAGHNIPLEDPRAVARALVRTVERCRPKELTR